MAVPASLHSCVPQTFNCPLMATGVLPDEPLEDDELEELLEDELELEELLEEDDEPSVQICSKLQELSLPGVVVVHQLAL